MIVPPSRLAALLAALTTASTTTATEAAAGELYDATRPHLVRICATLITRAPGKPWLAAEDLAQDTLVDALPALQRGACPNANNNGLLRWLTTVAWRRLLTEARPGIGVSDAEIEEVLLGTHARNSTVHGDDDSRTWRDRAVRLAHDAALEGLPVSHQRTWVLVAEHELPKTEAAAALGVSRRTVYNRLAQVETHLRAALAPYAP
ncbi:MAG: sigma-70 family RNA polymerase sigma factor [Gemmatimonadaceae bacterium]|nr:sigma-70 family RNA polymerase sigma factor [Gemmatimonadaceae bacterium]